MLGEGGVASGATCRSRLIGKNEMSPETIQVAPMATGTDLRVIHSVYCSGSLICTYLKKLCFILGQFDGKQNFVRCPLLGMSHSVVKLK